MTAGVVLTAAAVGRAQPADPPCPAGWPIDPDTGLREGPCGYIGCCPRPVEPYTQPTNRDQGETEMTKPSEIQFTGTGDSCTAVTAFLGGSNAGATHQWKSCTNDGGYVFGADGRQEFSPGDWIVRDEDGGFSVRRLQP